MAYKKSEITQIFNRIIEEIVNEGKYIRDILKEDWSPSTQTFFIWLDDEKKSKQYARACEIRAEILMEQMIHIAFTPEEGETVEMSQKGEGKKSVKEMKKTKGDMLGHRKLKVDTLKWVIAKSAPKKYGTKIDLTTQGEKIEGNSVPIVLEDGRSYEHLKNELRPE